MPLVSGLAFSDFLFHMKSMAFNVSDSSYAAAGNEYPAEVDSSNPEAVKAMLEHPATLLMPLLEGKNFFNSADDHQPVLVRKARFPSLPDAARSSSLLGMVEDSPVFGLDLDRETLPKGLLRVGEFLDLRSVLPTIDPEDAQLLGLSRALAHWHRMNGFCAVCGNPSEPAQAGHVRICTNPECAHELFPRTDPAVIVLAEHNGRCLLGRQKEWRANLYSAVAGFVEPCEDLESAVRRELMEETGIRSGEVRYFESQPWPFPSSLMAAFRAEALDEEIQPGDNELEDARWFSRREMLEALDAGTLSLPITISVSYRLIQSWFDEAEGANLEERIAP